MGGQLKTDSNTLGVLGLAKTVSRKPMVMVSGAGGLQEKGGRSPPPKRGRSGGGRCAAAPYKHRLAHDPGGRRPSGRAFRCVGFLGRSPKPFLHPFVGTKGCPRRVGVLTKPSKRLAPPKAITDYYLTGRGGWGAGLRFAEEASPPEAEPYFFSRRKRRARPGLMTGSARAMSMASSGTSRVTVAPAAV